MALDKLVIWIVSWEAQRGKTWVEAKIWGMTPRNKKSKKTMNFHVLPDGTQ